jgi:hypothetical protein
MPSRSRRPLAGLLLAGGLALAGCAGLGPAPARDVDPRALVGAWTGHYTTAEGTGVYRLTIDRVDPVSGAFSGTSFLEQKFGGLNPESSVEGTIAGGRIAYTIPGRRRYALVVVDAGRIEGEAISLGTVEPYAIRLSLARSRR